jgi:hypothetical protein
MPKLQRSIVTKTFTPRPRPVARAEEDSRVATVIGGVSEPEKPIRIVEARRLNDDDAPPALESGVYLAPDGTPEGGPQSDVTLIVYSWENVQPGTLSWLFPTFRAAVSAAYAMKNAVKWAIVRGDESNIDVARESGRVMIESC